MNYEEKLKKAEQHANKVKERQELKRIWHQYDIRNKIPTHKVVTLYLFILLNVVLCYALIAMWHFQDLTHLGLIITDVIGQLLTFVIYSHHSTSQTREGGIQYMALQEELKQFKSKSDEGDAVG